MAFIKLTKEILALNISTEENLWLENIISVSRENERILQTAFIAMPKYIKKTEIVLSQESKNQFLVSSNFSPEGWTLDKFARAYILLHFNPENEKNYVKRLNELFETAEMNELAILNSFIPLFSYPQNWLFQAKEAVRSNVGCVFDAIAFNNPYPSLHFDEAAWNLLVLKTIFCGKSIKNIYGLKVRSNQKLAHMVSDFAHTRWAIGKTISPEVWELVTPYIDNQIIKDIEKLFQSENEQEQNAAKLSCIQSDFKPAKNLLKKYTESFGSKEFKFSNQ
ncbi:MAG: EboA domain-containing protein [Bacteroidetes bacterium]|nr:EboA domain-containing protein [Bacteroidota bacterium]